MSWASDLRVLYHMAVKPVRGATHAERLEAFYRGQSGSYDDFRKRLLHGREEMLAALPLPEGGRWLDIGGGTGHNVEAVGDRRARLAEVTVVDLCPSLLKQAEQRIGRLGWTNVRLHLSARHGPGRRGYVHVLVDHDPRLVSGRAEGVRPTEARRRDRRRRLLHFAKVAGAGDAKALRVPTLLLADLVRLRQRLSLAGPLAVFAKPVRDGTPRRAPRRRALSVRIEGAPLYLCWPQNNPLTPHGAAGAP